MELKLIHRQGLDAQEIARWTSSEGFVDVQTDAPFLDDPAYEAYSADQMIDEFDGPDYFAVPVTEQKMLSEYGGGL